MKTFHILDGDIIKGVNFNEALNYLEKGVDVFDDSTNKKATKKEILKSKKEMDSMMFPPIPQIVVKESEG